MSIFEFIRYSGRNSCSSNDNDVIVFFSFFAMMFQEMHFFILIESFSDQKSMITQLSKLSTGFNSLSTKLLSKSEVVIIDYAAFVNHCMKKISIKIQEKEMHYCVMHYHICN